MCSQLNNKVMMPGGLDEVLKRQFKLQKNFNSLSKGFWRNTGLCKCRIINTAHLVPSNLFIFPKRKLILKVRCKNWEYIKIRQHNYQSGQKRSFKCASDHRKLAGVSVLKAKMDILRKSWQQHPTRHQLYSHLPPITKTIQARRTRHAGHCWRSKDELISDVLLWTPAYGQAKAGRPARTYIQQLCEDTRCIPEDLPKAMNDREKLRGRIRDIRASGKTWWWWYIVNVRQFTFATCRMRHKVNLLSGVFLLFDWLPYQG